MKNLQLILLSIFLFANHIFATTITCKVIDAQTKLPLEYISVRLLDVPTKGTFTNENGDYTFVNITLPSKVVVSNIAYKTDTFKLTKDQQVLQLQSAINELPEVEVGLNYALFLMIQAGNKLRDQKSTFLYATNFTRIYNYNDKNPSEINEVFFDVSVNSSGPWGFAFDKGRYMLKKGFMNKLNRNPSELMHGFYRVLNPWWIPKKCYFCDSLENNFIVKIDKFISIANQKHAIIKCTSKDNKQTMSFIIDCSKFLIKSIEQLEIIDSKISLGQIKGKLQVKVGFEIIQDSLSMISFCHNKSDVTFKSFLGTIKNQSESISYTYNFTTQKPVNFDKNSIKSMKEINISTIQKKMDQDIYDTSFWKNSREF